jgi:hypothetical protein
MMVETSTATRTTRTIRTDYVKVMMNEYNNLMATSNTIHKDHILTTANHPEDENPSTRVATRLDDDAPVAAPTVASSTASLRFPTADPNEIAAALQSIQSSEAKWRKQETMFRSMEEQRILFSRKNK